MIINLRILNDSKMKTKDFLALLAIAGIMIFASCKKDDPSPLTKEEATATLTTIDGNYTAEMASLEALPGKQSINAINDLGLPFSTPMKAPAMQKSFQKDMLKIYKPASYLASDGPFPDFAFYENVGTWHYVSGYWKKTSTSPTDKIVIVFSFHGGSENATLTYYGYDDKTITVTGKTLTYMSQLSAKVDIVGETNPVMTWNYTASLSGSSSSGSGKIKFEYNIGEFSRTQSLSISQSVVGLTSMKATITMSDEVKRNSAIIYSTSFTMNATGGQSGSFSMTVNAKFRVIDIVVKYDIIMDSTTDFEGDPSHFMTVSVWTAGGAKIADVVFHNESGIWVAYFKFTDDSEVRVDSYLNENLYSQLSGFTEEIMSVFSEFF